MHNRLSVFLNLSAPQMKKYSLSPTKLIFLKDLTNVLKHLQSSQAQGFQGPCWNYAGRLSCLEFHLSATAGQREAPPPLRLLGSSSSLGCICSSLEGFELNVCFGRTVIRRGGKPTRLLPASPIQIVHETNNITSPQLGSILTCQACIIF